MRKIIYQRLDGGVSVVHPVINTLGEVAGFTEAQAEQRAFAKLPADAINPRFVDAADIPTDRTFRDAWKPDLTVDMPKAREIHREHLRQMRAPLLAALDAEYLRADELGDLTEKARIASKKIALRNVTADPAIGAAITPERLAAVIPPILTPDTL